MAKEGKGAKREKRGPEPPIQRISRAVRPVKRFFSNHTTLMYFLLLLGYIFLLIYLLYRFYKV